MRPLRTFTSIVLGLLVLTALPGWAGSAMAQQQEKRIALVVGDGAYSKSPLATAANDAGLVAQTLQAAGFDVIGARDLDGDTLRKSFHDFIQKAEASGQNTVAMIYLSGYGVQLAGENYFIPVDTDIARDTDIPTEGIRISDYMHQLASLPLKASIVVLDAARQQPFIAEGGNSQIASGLALVEPENNMLVAFNAAPGTVAPADTGSYGVYAQSLAEMIRTGGLALPDLFDRLRMRVNENTKGAQVPWDAQKIQAEFYFFDRAPDAPTAQAPADQVAAIRTKPIRELPAQEAYSAAIARDTLQGYEDFVAGFPADPMAARVRAIIAARREAITWRRSYSTDTPPAYWSYLRRYPHGPHSWDARRRLEYLSAALEPPPSFAMIDYDVPPPPPAEFVVVDRPVVYFGDPDFGFAPPPPPPVYFLPPPPPDFVVLPPPFPVVGLFVLPQPQFVPMPAFVVAPRYVAPPPNNIIFNNTHNTTVINNVINVQPPPPPPGNVTAAVNAAANKPVGAMIQPPPIVKTQAQKILANPTTATLTPSQKALVQDPTAKVIAPPTNTNKAVQGTTIPANKSLTTTTTKEANPAVGTGVTPNTRQGSTPANQGTPLNQGAPANQAKGAGTGPANTATGTPTGPGGQAKGGVSPANQAKGTSPSEPGNLAKGQPQSPASKEGLPEKKLGTTAPTTLAKPEAKPEKPTTPTVEAKPEVKPQPKLEAKPAPKIEPKIEPKMEPKRAAQPPEQPKPAPRAAIAPHPEPPPPHPAAPPTPHPAAAPPVHAAPPPVHAPPPPPVAHVAPPPPPRPAPPPPPKPAAAAPKKCPPNQPKC